MGTTLSIPDRYLAIAPVIVTSPTTRCGTTLVQRLISASQNAFLYGEEVAQHVRMLARSFFSLVAYLEKAGDIVDDDFRRTLEGRMKDWRPALMAPTAVMLAAWVETFYQLPNTLDEFARTIDRPIWGFKFPGGPLDEIRMLLTLLPRARLIYVFRDLGDALKSAKARQFVTSTKQAQQFCAQWSTNMLDFLNTYANDKRVLLLRYEDMIGRREESVSEIEAFTGVEGIDMAEFDIKVNTFEGETSRGFSPTQYIAPASLTAAERAAVAEYANPVLSVWRALASAFRLAAT